MAKLPKEIKVKVNFDTEEAQKIMSKIDLIERISADGKCPMDCPENVNKIDYCECGLNICLETINKILKEK